MLGMSWKPGGWMPYPMGSGWWMVGGVLVVPTGRWFGRFVLGATEKLGLANKAAAQREAKRDEAKTDSLEDMAAGRTWEVDSTMQSKNALHGLHLKLRPKLLKS